MAKNYEIHKKNVGQLFPTDEIVSSSIISEIANNTWLDKSDPESVISGSVAINNGNLTINNSKAYSQINMALGENCSAGSKCFSIVSGCLEDKIWYLESTEGINIGDIWSVRLYRPFDCVGKVVKIVDQHVISVDSMMTKYQLRYHMPGYGSEFYVIDSSGNIVQDNLTSYPALDPYPLSGGYRAIISAYGYPGVISEDDDVMRFWLPYRPAVGIKAIGEASFSQGGYTKAVQIFSHAEGYGSIAAGKYSHAEGTDTLAGYSSHAEGYQTSAFGLYSHAEGGQTFTPNSIYYAHAEGWNTVAAGKASHAEGNNVSANGEYSHAEGLSSVANGQYSHAEGRNSIANAHYSHAEGRNSLAFGLYSHAEGLSSRSNGAASHGEGQNTIAVGNYSHAEGLSSMSIGQYSHAEGNNVSANGEYSHAEGLSSVTNGTASHSEGYRSIANKNYSHAEGAKTFSAGTGSHSAGSMTRSQGDYSVSFGRYAVTGRKQIEDDIQQLAVSADDYVVWNGTSWNKTPEIPENYIDATPTTLNYSFDMARNTDFAYCRNVVTGQPYRITEAGKLTWCESASELSGDAYSFVWNGANTPTSPYRSHGEGTFNVNPQNGLNGIFIGNMSLCSLLNIPNGKIQTLSDEIPKNHNHIHIELSDCILSNREKINIISAYTVNLQAYTDSLSAESGIIDTLSNSIVSANGNINNLRAHMDQFTNEIAIQNGQLVDVTEEVLRDISVINDCYTKTNGELTAFGSTKTTDFINIDRLNGYYVYAKAKSAVVTMVFYDQNHSFIGFDFPQATSAKAIFHICKIDKLAILAKYPSAKFIRLNTYAGSGFTFFKVSNAPIEEICIPVSADNANVALNQLSTYLYGYECNYLFGKKYIACGDSYTNGSGGTARYYPDIIAGRNKMEFINLGKAGMTLRKDMNDSKNSARTHFTDILEDSWFINQLSSADYITFMFGINDVQTDYTDKSSIYGELDSDAISTVYGSWNVTLSTVLSVNPGIKIGIIAPDYLTDINYHTALSIIGKWWGIPVLNIMTDPNIPMMINGKTYEINQYAKNQRILAFRHTGTNIHPTDFGHEYRSTIIENFMRSL